MNNKARNATLFGLAAGLILFPIARAVIRRYRSGQSQEASEGTTRHYRVFPAYRGKHKPHHRRTPGNGLH